MATELELAAKSGHWPEIKTPRLRLRRFEPNDVDAVLSYRDDPEVARYQSWTCPYSRARAIAFVDEVRATPFAEPGNWTQVALELLETGIVIGDVAFHTSEEEPRQAELGFSLATLYHRNGYATEAVGAVMDHLFRQLNYHRIVAKCDVRNSPSSRLLERLGFRCEAHHLSNVYIKGEWTDEYVYAMLADEWL